MTFEAGSIRWEMQSRWPSWTLKENIAGIGLQDWPEGGYNVNVNSYKYNRRGKDV